MASSYKEVFQKGRFWELYKAGVLRIAVRRIEW